MIATISGILKHKSPTELIVEVQGIGFTVNIPLSTYSKVGEVGTSVKLLTYLHVREDTLALYGFATEQERQLFRLLISVSGIGPKIGLGILSGISVEEFKLYIANGNVSALTAVPGIGRKTAERLIVELRESIAKISAIEEIPTAATAAADVRAEALLALTSLGYTQQAAEKAIRYALNEIGTTPVAVEELIKQALRHSSAR